MSPEANEEPSDWYPNYQMDVRKLFQPTTALGEGLTPGPP